ncbi:unnamed protein product [Rangifer tarandus platyrhynchus]|uniref:Uncharacterized protein n=1 Tax=Rangifer tarandus platyrhynchus TaxID=3082113 RepID=A0ABN9A0E9_RANTA|nr:unnamed protein product [Rangifer tarandus platyrhynchus]
MCVLPLSCWLEDPTAEKTSGEQFCLGPRAPGEPLCPSRNSGWGRCRAVFPHPSPGLSPAARLPSSPPWPPWGRLGPSPRPPPDLESCGAPTTGCFESGADACFPELESSRGEII